MCTVRAEATTLKDPPCIWQTSLRGTPKTGSERAGLWLMTEMAQLRRRRPGYGLKPSRIILELELEGNIQLCQGARHNKKLKFTLILGPNS